VTHTDLTSPDAQTFSRDYAFKKHRIQSGIASDDRFWEALEDNEFRLPRCAKCGHWIWPAVPRCGECGSWDIGWELAELAGHVFSWTRTHYLFDRVRGRAEEIPYVILLAEIPSAGGARIMGVLDGDSSINPQIGAPLVGIIRPPSESANGYPSVNWRLAP
jgi:uncharacterized OB-fold protein